MVGFVDEVINPLLANGSQYAHHPVSVNELNLGVVVTPIFRPSIQ